MKPFESRHRMLPSVAVLLALPLLTGADGKGCSGGGTIPIGSGWTGDGGDGAAGDAPAASCTLQPSAYDQSCQVDSDCEAVFLGNVCEDVCHGECPNGAINVIDGARYQADLHAVPMNHMSPTTACSCALGPGVCRGGRCGVLSPLDEGGRGVVCAIDTDCPKGDLCGFLETQGCAAKGTCFPPPGPTILPYAAGCACDGTEVNIAVSTGLPSGYAPKPLLHAGACADAGGSCTTDADCGSGGICGFPIAACAAAGTCFKTPNPVPPCVPLFTTDCTCDGATVSLGVQGCLGLPSGYAQVPLVHEGACADGGGSD
jgi:hypothetical protein